MRLGDYILRDSELILQRWEAFASGPPAVDQSSSLSVRVHGPKILRAIVADLESPQSPAERAVESNGPVPVPANATHTVAQTHAVLMAEGGFSIEQLTFDYRALRASVLRGWIEAGPPDATHFEDMVRFNEALDQALTESIAFVTAYVTRSRDLMLRNPRDAFRRIEDSNAELIQQYAKIHRLVVEQTQKQAVALHQANDANRTKTAFLRTISHELRTPLNSVIGFSGLLLDGSIDQPSEAQRKFLSIIQRSGQDLLNLVQEILDMASIEAGVFAVALAPVELRSVLEESRESMLLMSAERKVELRPLACKADLLVMADRDRLGQVIRNLLSNALKYTDQGFVQVRASRVDTLIRIEVEDTGVGIPKEQQTFLFQPFHRITGQAGALRPGTGLGLAISRRIVEAMGGSMGFESEEGRGSRFWLEVPTAPSPDDQRAGFHRETPKANRTEGDACDVASVLNTPSTDRGRAVDVYGVPRAHEDLATQAPDVSIDPVHVATHEDLLATVLARLLTLPRGRVALVEARFTDELLDVLAPEEQVNASTRTPKPESIDSPLAVTANLMLADGSAALRADAASQLVGALLMADAAGCVITSCCGGSDKDPQSAPAAVLVILPPGTPDER